MSLLGNIAIYQQFPSGGAYAPTDPTSATLKTWVDADDISTLFKDAGVTAPSDTDNVYRWTDKGDFGFYWENSTGSIQPQYLTNQLNSRPGIKFSGYGVRLIWRGGGYEWSLAQPLTIYEVWSPLTAGGGAYIFQDNFGARASDIRSDSINRARINIGGTADLINNYTDATGTAAMMSIWEVDQSGGNNRFRSRLNSGQSFTVTTSNMTASELGGYQYYASDRILYEVLVYDGILNTSDDTAVRGYLTGKWGSALVL